MTDDPMDRSARDPSEPEDEVNGGPDQAPAAKDVDPVDEGRRRFAAWLWRVPVLLAVAGGGFGVYEAIRIHFDKHRPDPTPTFEPVTPTRVAAVGAFARAWSAVPFALAGSGGARRSALPGFAIRLPGPIPGGLDVEIPELEPSAPGTTGTVATTGTTGTTGTTEAGQGTKDARPHDLAHLAAFSRVCTHQGCIVDYNTDLAAIDFGFNYGADHPAFTCPCHLSVFDPTLAGRVVSGPAVRPLPRVSLRVQDGEVWAVGVERD